MQPVHEPQETRLAVFGVDHRSRKMTVETVDRAGWQRANGASWIHVAGLIKRSGGLAGLVDWHHLRGRERMLADIDGDLVHEWVWPRCLATDDVLGRDAWLEDLVALVTDRVLLAFARSGGRCPAGELNNWLWSECLRNRQLIGERRHNQRARWIHLGVNRAGQRD